MTFDPTAARARLDALTGYMPGPWRKHGNGRQVVADHGGLICTMRDGAISKPNSRLIAAAPDLAADLAAALDEVERLRDKQAAIEKALDQINANPEMQRGLAVFYDHWGLDAYSAPAHVEAAVRNLVAWILSSANARAAMKGGPND